MDKFHGKGKKSQFFEGWYFKHHKDGRVLALIPGISVDREKNKTAFLQVVDDETARYILFPYDDFRWEKGVITLGKNSFSLQGIDLDIHQPGLELRGRLRYGYPTPLFQPIMGPFAHIPMMECYHEILSMNHCLSGQLEYNGRIVDFQGGKGYIEKDWGRSFPTTYRWMQANDFGPRNISVMAAIANIPTFRFTGCIATLFLYKEIYTFATYQGVRILKNDEGCIILAQKNRRLHINAAPHMPLKLMAPKQGAMERTIHEHASTRIKLEFFQDDVLKFSGESVAAGYESVSN